MVILASSSPRRAELLKLLDMQFKVVSPNIDESFSSSESVGGVGELVVNIARQKAEAVEEKIKNDIFYNNFGKGELNDIIIAADTMVVYRNHILGKPYLKEEALKMLKMLSGKWHKVYTGVCVIIKSKNKEEKAEFYEITKVKFRKLATEEIEYYVSTNEPLDKAGAYGIQGVGSVLVEKIDGDWTNVVGLPMPKLWKILFDRGIVGKNGFGKWA